MTHLETRVTFTTLETRQRRRKKICIKKRQLEKRRWGVGGSGVEEQEQEGIICGQNNRSSSRSKV